jgi:hypothetical protein
MQKLLSLSFHGKDGIRGCTTQAFPGATIGRITELLSRGKINISNIDIIIIHVGTKVVLKYRQYEHLFYI